MRQFALHLGVDVTTDQTLELNPVPNPIEIFVGNLPYRMFDNSLLKLFFRFGDVKKASIRLDKETGRSVGFALVQMASTPASLAAIAELNGKEIVESGEYASAYDLPDELADDSSSNKRVSVVHIIETASRALATLICNEPGRILDLEWRDLERMLATVFDGIGYAVRLTPGSKDKGKDIVVGFVVSGKTHSYYVEVKHWVSGKKVGERQIKEFISVVVGDQQEGGILISTSGFTASAMQGITEIERKKLRFGTSDTIVTLCRTYLNVARGLVHPLTCTDNLISLTQGHTTS
jgi:HJR/Mrr/RecB family endonuclease